MPGNESVTDNMKSFVGGVALKQAFYNIKTYNTQAISTAITNHNADAAHRHLPAVPTTSPPTGTFSYLTNSQTPAWSTLPTSDAVDSSSSSQLATSKAVSTLNTNIGTKTTGTITGNQSAGTFVGYVYKLNHIVHVFGYFSPVSTISSAVTMFVTPWTNNGKNTFFMCMADNGTVFTLYIAAGSKTIQKNSQSIPNSAFVIVGSYYTDA